MAALPAAQEVQVKEKDAEVEQKQEEPDHPDFSGKWKLISSEGLEAFCEAAGITGMNYTMQKKSERKHTQTIEQDANFFTVKMNTQTFERELTYTINGTTPFEYRDQHKNIISAEAIWSKDGQKIIIKAKVYPKGVDPNQSPDKFKRRSEFRYLKKKKMYEEIIVDGEKLVRKFQKM
mmetsp:Transcript_73286/g.116816  ORF Transcript_73286/g.116816 Transcript_73286/m.116816 type:complete len:177 (-) Transcript_73286:141-671(-)|eukprot:CAMPEP_0197058328 /NCGR_PEP_ID=MMETSP1384-20130603/106476_1 /TAXON_ID=29189 /ORGANISM="Ammonia sp." /LENGTH=176 /DNA_ID=CAMNT_0042493041 /DNA_START=21 /DNA_END=551 /DNA_ORIENTATION=-